MSDFYTAVERIAQQDPPLTSPLGPSFDDLLQSFINSLTTLTLPQFLLLCTLTFVVEFHFFFPPRVLQWSRDVLPLSPSQLPLAIHFTLFSLLLTCYFSATTSASIGTMLGLLFIATFLCFRLLALVINDSQATHMSISSLFIHHQSTTLITPLSLQYQTQLHQMCANYFRLFYEYHHLYFPITPQSPQPTPDLNHYYPGVMDSSESDDDPDVATAQLLQRFKTSPQQNHTPLSRTSHPHSDPNIPIPPLPITISRVTQTVPAIPVLFVIAHPDDESMFYTPLLHLIAEHNALVSAPLSGSPQDRQRTEEYCRAFERSNHVTPPRYEVHILCLTTGNASGLGSIRVDELRSTCIQIHSISPGNITIIDAEKDGLVDSMTLPQWSVDTVHFHIAEYIKTHNLTNIPTPEVSEAELKVHFEANHGRDNAADNARRKISLHTMSFHDLTILTFDQYGVSGHGNHTSCYNAVKLFALHHNNRVYATATELIQRYNVIYTQQCQQLQYFVTNKDNIVKIARDTQELQLIDIIYQQLHDMSNISQFIHNQRYITAFGVETVPFAHKYLGPLSSLFLLSQEFSTSAPPTPRTFIPQQQQQNPQNVTSKPPQLRFIIPNTQSIQSWNAMSSHWSQWVWFRKLFVLFSTYTYITSLIPIQTSIQFDNIHAAAQLRSAHDNALIGLNDAALPPGM